MSSFNYMFPVILESVVSLDHFVPGVIFSETSNVQVLKGLGVGRSRADVLNSRADMYDPFPRLWCARNCTKGGHTLRVMPRRLHLQRSFLLNLLYFSKEREEFSRIVKTSYEILMAGCFELESTQRLSRLSVFFLFEDMAAPRVPRHLRNQFQA